MGMEKLRKRYRTFEAKREVLLQYDAFLVEDRVELLLLVKEAKRVLRSTVVCMFQGGTCLAIKAGHTGMAPAALAVNVRDVPRVEATQAPLGWANVPASTSRRATAWPCPSTT